MSIIISLCLLLKLSFIRSCARVTEFSNVNWLPRFRRCCKFLLSLLAALYDCACILFYTRYINDIFIIYDPEATDNDYLTQYTNTIHSNLQFKSTLESDGKINFLEITITRRNTLIEIYIYRKPTTTDTIIHFTSTEPIEHKLANWIKPPRNHTPHHNQWGIHKLTCNTCNLSYVGQTSRSLNICYKEHIRYIRSNNPQSAYALHILQNRHEYGPMDNTMTLLKHINNQSLLLPYEQYNIQVLHRHRKLIPEQSPGDTNPLFQAVINP